MIHFLNVKEGDCSIIQHKSGHVSVIDISNGNADTLRYEQYSNYNQKAHPTNPIEYMQTLKIKDIFRFILTHPDMDHMDGIGKLFATFEVCNFWDTDNNKKMDGAEWGTYKKEDWDYYQNARKSSSVPKVLQLLSGAEGEYYYNNADENETFDGLFILAPDQDLVDYANETDQYNNISYVILYMTCGKKIIFAGDSEKKTWDMIIEKYPDLVSDVDVLVAPHHGRKSGGNDTYLDILNPKVTLFGNAPSGDLDYSSWNNRGLKHFTNNQAGDIIIIPESNNIGVYCSNKSFAKDNNAYTFFSTQCNAWCLTVI